MSDSSPLGDAEEKLEPSSQPAGESEVVHPADEPERAGSAGGADTTEMKDRMLGEFRLIRRLGRGGMADVFLAEQTSLKRNVAVKILRSDQLGKSGGHVLKRFKQEAKAAGGLNHPNIVQVYSVGEQDGVHYITQEYVQGRTLRNYLIRKGPPELPLALHIMKQVASALQAAADAGIVHRDIKPENIMISRKGEVKVADFGLALLMQPEERVDLTQHGMTLGTPSYMSPEQVNGEKIDQRSDIYSFGVTCYHMLVGKPPFRGGTALSVAVQHVSEEPEPLSKRRPDLPPVLCEIVHKMMHKKADDRYQTAQSVLTDLRRVAKALKQQPETAAQLSLSQFETDTAPPKERRQRFVRSCTKRPLLLFVVLFVLLGSASAGVGWLLRPRNPFDKPAVSYFDVQKQATAKDQFLMAMRAINDEDAWRAVIEFFPIKKFPDAVFEYRRAQERLAMLYLSTRQYEKAEDLFKKLASLGSEHAELRVKGVAGLAVIASLKDDYQESQRIIGVKLIPDMKLLPRPRQLDPVMEGLIHEAIARNRKHLGDQIKKDFEELFRRASSDDSAPLIDEEPAQ